MIQKFLNKYFFFLYVFTLCFGVLLYNTTGFKGLDVLSSLILIVLYGIYLVGTKNRSFNIGFLVILLVFLFYLNYSLYIANNTWNAIAIDFLTQLRPYIAFFIVSQMSPTFTDKQKAILKKICFYLWLFFIPIGLLATVNPTFLSKMMDQPSNYTASITCLAIVYLYCSNYSVKDKLTFILMLSIGLIVVNSQFTIFFLVVCGLIMYFHHIDVLKNKLKTGFAIDTITSLIIYISRTEIVSYLFSAGFAGDGFASHTGQTTADFFSQINDYGFNPINGLIHQEWFSGSVSYYPILAQLGFIGIMLYLLFWVYIISTSIVQFKQKGDIQPFIIILVLASFIFLENISYSYFTSNKGYFMMMFIGLLLGKPENADNMVLFSEKSSKKKKKLSALQSFWFIRKKNSSFSTKNEITYLIPPVSIGKTDVSQKVKVDSTQVIPQIINTDDTSISLSEKKEVTFQVKEEVNPPITFTPNIEATPEMPVEVIHSNPPIKLPALEEPEEVNIAVNIDLQNASLADIQQLNEAAVEVHSKANNMSLEEETDEYEWEDDLDEEYEEEYDWENESEDDNIVEESSKILKKEDKEEVAEETVLFNSPIQTHITNTYTPDMTFIFTQTNESLLVNTGYKAEDYGVEEFPEESFNYMI